MATLQRHVASLQASRGSQDAEMSRLQQQAQALLISARNAATATALAAAARGGGGATAGGDGPAAEQVGVGTFVSIVLCSA